MTRWPLYLRLQTDLAFPHGPSADLEHVQHALPVVQGFGSVLVVGPGGAGEIELLRRGNARVVGLTALSSEHQAIVAAGQEGILGDMHEMPLPNASFDAVFSCDAMEHAFAPYIVLMEIRRVLKDGGFAYIVFPEFDGEGGGVGPFHLHCLDMKVWQELLRKVGLAVERVETVMGIAWPASRYFHTTCRAVTPPSPHDQILASLQEHVRRCEFP